MPVLKAMPSLQDDPFFQATDLYFKFTRFRHAKPLSADERQLGRGQRKFYAFALAGLEEHRIEALQLPHRRCNRADQVAAMFRLWGKMVAPLVKFAPWIASIP